MPERAPKLEIVRDEILFDGKFISVTGRHFLNRETGANGL